MTLTQATKTELYRFFVIAFDAAPGVEYMGQLAQASQSGMSVQEIVEVFTTKPQFTAVYPIFLTSDQFAKKLVANVVGESAGAEAKAEAEADVVGALNAGWSRGEVIYQIFNNLAGKSFDDPVWGATAQQLANQVAVAQYYTEEGVAGNDTTNLATLQSVIARVDQNTDVSTSGAIEAVITAGGAGIVKLTNSPDIASANVFNSSPVYTPGGNDFINSLQDEDVLTGIGANPTLNVILGDPNDSAEYMVTPTLRGVETVNVESTGDNSGINFQDATGLKTLNVNRMTSPDGDLWLVDLDKTTVNLSVNNVTRYGDLVFDYREEVLTATDDVLNLGLNGARLEYLELSTASDGGADDGYFFETINLTTSGNNDIDNFLVQGNGREDELNGLDAGSTRQVLNIVANGTPTSGSLEINWLAGGWWDGYGYGYGYGESSLDEISIVADARVDIAGNKLAALSPGNDGLSTPDLEKVTISGAANVMIDGLDTEKQAGGVTLTVDAGAMTGNLKLGVQSSADVNSSTEYDYRADKDLSVTSGSGNDEIVTYGDLAGDISTNAGNDMVVIGEDGDHDVEGVSTIDTGGGNDIVRAGDLLATATDEDEEDNDGFDDVTAARIETGAGDDTVWVRFLDSAADWDNKETTDANADDVYFMRGASVDTGEGNDTIRLVAIAEGASVNADAGNDTLTIEQLTAPQVMIEQVQVGNVHLAADDISENEVQEDGETEDVFGARVQMGGGDDVVNFAITDAEGNAIFDAAGTLVGAGAELDGGDGNDVLNVSALRDVTVAEAVGTVDAKDVNATILGVETANLTVENQVTAVQAATYANSQRGFWIDSKETTTHVAGNVTDLPTVAVTADIQRFDSALKTINLVSNERAMLLKAGVEQYEAGSATAFELNNLREGIAISLKANEATGVTGGKIKDDADSDVFLTIDNYVATGTADQFTLDIAAGSGAFDLSLTSQKSRNPADHDKAASKVDDDNELIEQIVINLASDDKGHAFDLNGFGDEQFTDSAANLGSFMQWRNPDAEVNRSYDVYSELKDVATTGEGNDKLEFGQGRAAATSLTINGTQAATKVVVTEVSADAISVLGAADVTLTVSEYRNNYEIKTGSGNDRIVMTGDLVDDEDAIDAGAGRNTLVIDGGNSMGFDDQQRQRENDDVWGNKSGIQVLEIANDGDSQKNTIVLDEEAYATGIEEINLTGTGSQETTFVIGDDFTRALNLVAEESLDFTSITVNSYRDTAPMVMNTKLYADGGARFVLDDLYRGITPNLTIQLNDVGGATTIEDMASPGDGDVDIEVSAGRLASITLVDMNKDVDEDGKFDDGDADNGTIDVTVDSAWSTGTMTFDANGIDNFDQDGETGGMDFDGSGAGGKLVVKGTANNDTVTGGNFADTLIGGAGDDIIAGEADGNVVVPAQEQISTVAFASSYDAGDLLRVTYRGDVYEYEVASAGTFVFDASQFLLNGSGNSLGEDFYGTIEEVEAEDGVWQFTGGFDGTFDLSADIVEVQAKPSSWTFVFGSQAAGYRVGLEIEGTQFISNNIASGNDTDLANAVALVIQQVESNSSFDDYTLDYDVVGQEHTLTVTRAQGSAVSTDVKFATDVSLGSAGSPDGITLDLTAAASSGSLANGQDFVFSATISGTGPSAQTIQLTGLNASTGNGNNATNLAGSVESALIGKLVSNEYLNAAAGSGTTIGQVLIETKTNADWGTVSVTFTQTSGPTGVTASIGNASGFPKQLTGAAATGDSFNEPVPADFDEGSLGGSDQGAPQVELEQVGRATEEVVTRLEADVLTGGADKDVFVIRNSDDNQNMLTDKVYDTITDLDLGGLKNNASPTTVDKIQLDFAINGLANAGATVALVAAPTLEAAVSVLFQQGDVFLSQVNKAGLFTYGGETYLIAAGEDASNQFGVDDVIVKVTGVTGQISLDDFVV